MSHQPFVPLKIRCCAIFPECYPYVQYIPSCMKPGWHRSSEGTESLVRFWMGVTNGLDTYRRQEQHLVPYCPCSACPRPSAPPEWLALQSWHRVRWPQSWLCDYDGAVPYARALQHSIRQLSLSPLSAAKQSPHRAKLTHI